VSRRHLAQGLRRTHRELRRARSVARQSSRDPERCDLSYPKRADRRSERYHCELPCRFFPNITHLDAAFWRDLSTWSRDLEGVFGYRPAAQSVVGLSCGCTGPEPVRRLPNLSHERKRFHSSHDLYGG